MTQDNKREELSIPEGLVARAKLADWLNAFKADPFSTGDSKVDRLIEVIAGLSPHDRNRELEEALRLFVADERFQVTVGGNPVAVKAAIAQARAALSKVRGEA